jgi:hypothetical protein
MQTGANSSPRRDGATRFFTSGFFRQIATPVPLGMPRNYFDFVRIVFEFKGFNNNDKDIKPI